MKIKVYKSGIHLGEERIIEGNHSSGMITFSDCHLSCNFCYTPETSVLAAGDVLTPSDLLNLVEELVVRGARNLNLISPTHVWPLVRKPIAEVKAKYGPRLPLVAKITGYESCRTLQSFAQVTDVFVPDFKVLAESAATSVHLPKNYGQVARKALREMALTHGTPGFNTDGKMVRGILVRHLLMPDFFEDSLSIIEALVEDRFSGFLNLMTYFLDPHTKRLGNANPGQVALLSEVAEKAGIQVLINGKGKPHAPPHERKATHALPA